MPDYDAQYYVNLYNQVPKRGLGQSAQIVDLLPVGDEYYLDIGGILIQYDLQLAMQHDRSRNEQALIIALKNTDFDFAAMTLKYPNDANGIKNKNHILTSVFLKAFKAKDLKLLRLLMQVPDGVDYFSANAKKLLINAAHFSDLNCFKYLVEKYESIQLKSLSNNAVLNQFSSSMLVERDYEELLLATLTRQVQSNTVLNLSKASINPNLLQPEYSIIEWLLLKIPLTDGYNHLYAPEYYLPLNKGVRYAGVENLFSNITFVLWLAKQKSEMLPILNTIVSAAKLETILINIIKAYKVEKEKNNINIREIESAVKDVVAGVLLLLNSALNTNINPNPIAALSDYDRAISLVYESDKELLEAIVFKNLLTVQDFNEKINSPEKNNKKLELDLDVVLFELAWSLFALYKNDKITDQSHLLSILVPLIIHLNIVDFKFPPKMSEKLFLLLKNLNEYLVELPSILQQEQQNIEGKLQANDRKLKCENNPANRLKLQEESAHLHAKKNEILDSLAIMKRYEASIMSLKASESPTFSSNGRPSPKLNY